MEMYRIKRQCTSLLILLALIVGISTPCYAAQANSKPHQKVLFISSYGYDWDSVPWQIEGVSSILSEEAEIEYLFMNTKKLPYDSAKQATYADVETLYAINEAYNLVIVEDDAALDFALEYREQLFSGIPIVFIGINTEEKASLAH